MFFVFLPVFYSAAQNKRFQQNPAHREKKHPQPKQETPPCLAAVDGLPFPDHPGHSGADTGKIKASIPETVSITCGDKAAIGDAGNTVKQIIAAGSLQQNHISLSDIASGAGLHHHLISAMATSRLESNHP